MHFNVLRAALLLILALPASLMAGSSTEEHLHWSLISSEHMSSTVRVFKNSERIGDYTLSCDIRENLPITAGSDETQESESNRVDIVIPPAHPEGLLIARCRQGAHSMRLSVFDLSSPQQEPLWEKVGSYYANWQLNENNELRLNYDEPCNEKSCEAPFRAVTKQWPIKQ